MEWLVIPAGCVLALHPLFVLALIPSSTHTSVVRLELFSPPPSDPPYIPPYSPPYIPPSHPPSHPPSPPPSYPPPAIASGSIRAIHSIVTNPATNGSYGGYPTFRAHYGDEIALHINVTMDDVVTTIPLFKGIFLVQTDAPQMLHVAQSEGGHVARILHQSNRPSCISVTLNPVYAHAELSSFSTTLCGWTSLLPDPHSCSIGGPLPDHEGPSAVWVGNEEGFRSCMYCNVQTNTNHLTTQLEVTFDSLEFQSTGCTRSGNAVCTVNDPLHEALFINLYHPEQGIDVLMGCFTYVPCHRNFTQYHQFCRTDAPSSVSSTFDTLEVEYVYAPENGNYLNHTRHAYRSHRAGSMTVYWPV